MKEAFIAKRFSPASLKLIQTSEQIIQLYRRQGLTLSLRQLFYQHVALHSYPNTEQSYKNLGSVISDARKAGLIDWNAIEDRGRQVYYARHWRDPAHAIDDRVKEFQIDKWADQPNFVIVMVEKQALEGVIWPVCYEEDVRFIANKGYSSDSALYGIAQALLAARRNGRSPHVIYLGDHDPSGIDMTRDVRDRLELFTGDVVGVHRIALNYAQVEEYQPPPNPAKMTDSRAGDYVERFGYESWELDALEPSLLASLVRGKIDELRASDLYEAKCEEEDQMRSWLKDMAHEYRERMEEEGRSSEFGNESDEDEE